MSEIKTMFAILFESLENIAKNNDLVDCSSSDKLGKILNDDTISCRVFNSIFDNINNDTPVNQSEICKYLYGKRSFTLNYGDKRAKYRLSEIKLEKLLMINRNTYYENVEEEALRIQRIFAMNKDIVTVEFVNREENYITLNNYYDFYRHAFVTLTTTLRKKKSEGDPIVFLRIKPLPSTSDEIVAMRLKNNTFITYEQYLSMLCDFQNMTKYQAAALTIPDLNLTWTDHSIDISEHFLKPYEDKIERSENTFEQIEKISTDISSPERVRNAIQFITNKKNLKKSVRTIYSTNAHLYVKNYFAKITNTSASLKKEFEKMLHLLIELCEYFSDYGISQINNLSDYICRYENRTISNKDISSELEKLCICFFKLSLFVLYYQITGKLSDFELIPLAAGDTYIQFYSNNIIEIENTSDIIDKLKKYSLLPTSLHDKSEEFINRLANDILTKSEFVAFINNPEVQNILLSGPDELIEDITQLYDIIYSHIKFRLYRGYHNINDNAGIMRNSFTDKLIVYNYINNNMQPLSFRRNNGNGEQKEFILRLAQKNDISAILRLNEPQIPYRRAIYVKSEKGEIEDAISKGCVWIIEEKLCNNDVNLACVAVILRCNNNQRINFSSDSLNEKFEKAYFDKVKHNFTYLDFDSILVNDGRSGINEISYRGYGFQRFFLVLAEEIARKEGCEYICCTVSTLNKPSKRNFILNGYIFDSVQAYTLTDSESDYYIYSKNNPTELQQYNNTIETELEMYHQENIFDTLNIDETAYREDRDVPRDFMVLLLTDK